MSTLRISNIEAKSVPASATIDEKVKITNSSGDTLVFIDGKTSGITTVGINTTDSNITFDANSNVVVTGIITATRFSGQITPTSLEIGSNIKLGNAGVITATSFVGSGANLTSLPAQATIANNADNRVITGGSGVNLNGEAGLTYDGSALIVRGSDAVTGSGGTKTISLRGGDANNEFVNLSFDTGAGGPLAVISAKADATGVYPNTTGSLTFNTQVGGGIFERLRITSDGKIGQGATSPSYDFHSYKASGTTRARLQTNGTSGSDYADMVVQAGGGNYIQQFIYGTGFGYMNGSASQSMSYGNIANAPVYFSTNNISRALFDTSGNLQILDGNLKINTAGHGIDFSATGDSAGNQGSSELLDDYEEGSWTPAFKAGNNSTACPTTVSEAKYTRVGRLVTATAYFTLNSYASGGTGGDTRIVGLPYQNIGDHGGVSINYWWSLKQNITFMAGTVQGNSSEILIRATTSAAVGTDNIDFDNTFESGDSLILTATYYTS